MLAALLPSLVVMSLMFGQAWGAVKASVRLIPAAARQAIAPPRRVFAHYVMCCTLHGPNVSVPQLGQEIALARDAGLDGFVLNVGAWTRYPSYASDTKNFFAAARATATQFKLFFSLDPSGGLTPAEGADIIATYRTDPAYFRVNGMAVVSTFASSDRWNRELRALLQRRGIAILLVPHMVSTRDEGESGGHETPGPELVARFLTDDPELAGYSWFGAAAPGRTLGDVSRAAALAARRLGKFYIAPITPYYLGHNTNNRVFDNAGFAGLDSQWMAAIEGGATWAQIVTWNDWEERSYVRPLGVGAQADTGQWGPRNPHDGFLDASRYFIDWYKSGRKPTIRSTRAFVAFRPDPVSRCIKDRYACPAGTQTLSDTLYVVVEAAAATSVTLNAGDRTRTFAIPAGRTSLRMPMARGDVSIALSSRGLRRYWRAPVGFAIVPNSDRLNMVAFTVPLE
ncbi:endo-1,3-alpha-glucanase family glycosylhydrolase [Sphingomonas sp. CFBP 13720]|uniref:endo-1,3-alpha-glucanase family glycosylhydrolase n=1 Tax=Sphingomonas sp. CFBP 13720 TaxID=2775302 RepID=UPI0017850289|nr:endo-1,3-alpha-glucanase family glycosylhydrolase [Sphingomonas sp. CFBP 13720]MBD8679946.1 hypothetical protein [Sphingomonas sp. CFBP 13720]